MMGRQELGEGDFIYSWTRPPFCTYAVPTDHLTYDLLPSQESSYTVFRRDGTMFCQNISIDTRHQGVYHGVKRLEPVKTSLRDVYCTAHVMGMFATCSDTS